MDSNKVMPLESADAPGSKDGEPTASIARPATEDKRGREICRTCVKKGDHWTFECPDKYLAPQAQTFLDKSPSADGTTAPATCSVCMKAVDRHEADVLRQRAELQKRRAEAMRRCNGAVATGRNQETSIRVTNLPENTSQLDLYNLAKSFGVGIITNTELAPDEQTGPSRQFGIVEFDGRKSAEEAISRLNGYCYDGFILKAEWKTPEPEEVCASPPICAVCVRDAEAAIRVTNMPENASQRDLYNVAASFGLITRVYLASDLASDVKNGSAGTQSGIVVQFVRTKGSEGAITRLDGYLFGGLTLGAEIATPADLAVFYAVDS